MGLQERLLVNRRARRLKLDAKVVVRDRQGRTAAGRVVDLSSHGCQVELNSGYLTTGKFVTLRLGILEPWPGIVRWGDRRVYGIEFANELYGPVVDHLVRTNRSLVATRLDE